MSGTTGTASTAVTPSPAEEKAADKARLLTALVNVCGVPHAHWKTHHIVLALKRDGVTQFNVDFIHMTAADIAAVREGRSPCPIGVEFQDDAASISCVLSS